jgi:hypothetical protein
MSFWPIFIYFTLNKLHLHLTVLCYRLMPSDMLSNRLSNPSHSNVFYIIALKCVRWNLCAECLTSYRPWQIWRPRFDMTHDGKQFVFTSRQLPTDAAAFFRSDMPRMIGPGAEGGSPLYHAVRTAQACSGAFDTRWRENFRNASGARAFLFGLT